MILLWGLPADPPMARLRHALEARGADVRFVDQRANVSGVAELSVTDGEVAGRLQAGGQALDLAECTAAYVRPFETDQLAAVHRAGPGSAEGRRAAAFDQLLLDWTELTKALVVNRPSAGALNASKPMQGQWLRSLGFRVPDTLVTTDPAAVHEFRERHRRVIYKSVSGVRSIVAELTDAATGRVDDVRWCPTQFQELVSGTDVRVHVVGGEVFAHEICSDVIDYRYAFGQGGAVTVRAFEVPNDVEQRCRAATGLMGLAFGGVDLRRTPEGEWCCFEVNPSPGFTYFQDWTGQPIDDAVARLLIAGRAGNVPARNVPAGAVAVSA